MDRLKNDKDMKEKLFLIDGSGFIYRAFYGIKGLKTSKGFPTNAIHGFYKMIDALIKEKQPEYLAVVFDRPRAELFRTQMFPEYKANRSDMPEELVPQVPYIKQMVDALSIPAIEVPRYEADDVIATLAQRFSSPEIDVTIVTGDKDLMQCVTPSVSLYDGMKKIYSREPEVMERFGVKPEMVPDVLGLAGDTSDNIPGVDGVGEKTAKALIQEFGSLEDVLANADNVSGKKRKENLKNCAENARMSKTLATVRYDAPIDMTLEQMKLTAPDVSKLMPLLQELEMSSTATAYQPAEKGVVEIYTDGSGLPDGRGGYGIVLRFGEHQKELSGAEHNTTSQRMELTAAIKGLEAVKGQQSIHVVSDSQYLVKGMNEWLAGWENSGRLFNCDKLANKDLWQQLLSLSRQHFIRWTWVKGHAGHHFNERCDRLAREAIDAGEEIAEYLKAAA